MWRSSIPTLKGQSCIAMRCAEFNPAKPTEPIVFIRVLDGFENMQLSGWDACMYSTDRVKQGEGYSSSLLTSLAGNAFNAFQCLPLCMAALAVLGQAGVPAVIPMNMSVESLSDSEAGSGSE